MKNIETSILVIRVHPSAKTDELLGIMDDNSLKLKLKAKPIAGQANTSLIDFLSKMLNIKKGDMEIISGYKSRVKKLRIIGLGQEELNQLLKKLFDNYP